MSTRIDALSMEGDGPSILPIDEVSSALPWQSILDKMADPELDAFQRMKIALYELLPAIAEDKEKNLSELAETFEEVVDIETLIDEVQTMFNDIKNADSNSGLGDEYVLKLLDLKDAISAAGGQSIDKDLADQLAVEIQGMVDDIHQAVDADSNNATMAIKQMWNTFGTPEMGNDDQWDWVDPVYPYAENPLYTETHIGQLKTQLDGFNDVGAGVSGFSAALQNELQFEIANYQQFLAVQDEMYREDMGTMKAHVSKMVPR